MANPSGVNQYTKGLKVALGKGHKGKAPKGHGLTPTTPTKGKANAQVSVKIKGARKKWQHKAGPTRGTNEERQRLHAYKGHALARTTPGG